MKMYKKILFLLMVVIPFSGFLQGTSFAERPDVLPFEPEDTLEEIRAKIKHNGYQFTVGHNWVFDMPAKQKQKFLSRKPSLSPKSLEASQDIGPIAKHIGEGQLPSAFDWRDHNGHSYIGPIRNQGDCGSCYAFGACAAAEGTYNWANGRYDANCADFSEAFVAFCLSDHYSGFDGCYGANYDYEELDALVDYGVCNETVYPYTDYEQSCQSSAWDAPRTTFQSWHRIGCNDIEAIKTAIITYGVVDAAVYVGSAFQAYSGGPYEDSNTSCNANPCYDATTNHAVALVGWDDNGGDGYWILRNSWGTGWGENGYMRIKYTSANVACAVVYLTLGAVPASCPDCPANGVITNATYYAGTTCTCSNATSITLGANVTVENGAAVTFTAPTVTVQPGFHAETGAVVNMRQP